MTTLTQQQTELIKDEIAQRGISHPELGEELLDHICTAVEAAMATGESFEQAYQQVMNRFKKHELKQVEIKTQALLAGESIYYPHIKQSFGLMVLYVVLLALWHFLIVIVRMGFQVADTNLYINFFDEHILFIQSVQVCGALLLTILFGRMELKVRGFTKVDIFPHQPFPLSIFPLILGILFLSLLWMETAATLIPFSEGYQALVMHHLNFYKPLPVIVFIGILWPVLSEILFRGIILKGLLRKYAALPAILCASIFYAISLFNPYGIPSLFLIDLFSGWLFYRTHSLIPSIIAVIFVQLPGLLHILLAKPRYINQLLIWKNLIGNDTLYYSLGVLSFLLTIFLIWRLKKMLNLHQPSPQLSLE